MKTDIKTLLEIAGVDVTQGKGKLLVENTFRNEASYWIEQLEAIYRDMLDSYAVGDVGPDIISTDDAIPHMPPEYHKWRESLNDDQDDDWTDMCVELEGKLRDDLFDDDFD